MRSSSSVEERQTALKLCTMTKRDSSFYISVWKADVSNGRGHLQKYVPLPGRNTDGSWKGSASNSQKP